MKIEFHIPHLVRPKQSVKGGKWGYYTPYRIKRNAAALRLLAIQHRPDKPLTGPLRFEVEFQFPYRKSEPKKNRVGVLYKDTKPDWDNLAKQICDVLEDCGYFLNDSQIAIAVVRKVYTDSPGVSVCLSNLTKGAHA